MAEGFEAREACPYVAVLHGDVPTAFVLVQPLTYDGPEAYAEHALIEDAMEAGGNAVGNLVCTPGRWDDADAERDAAVNPGNRRVRCVADAFRDPARPLLIEDEP